MSKELSSIRVVALLGNESQHRNTLATLIKNGINVVGVCIVENNSYGIPLSYILKSIKKRGFLITISRILARIIYLLFNSKLDKKLSKEIFNDEENQRIIENSNIKQSIARKFSFHRKFISQLNPDILIVHTKSWVNKDIREIKSVKYVIGGHPGITQFYRGAHSSFWAIYNNDFSNIGWTTFILNNGVDTGPIIDQGFFKPLEKETYVSLNLRGMKYIAESQVKSLKIFAENGVLKSKSHKILKNTEYNLPTLRQQLRYWRIQKIVR